MPEFKSSIGKKTFVGQPLREFDIPDEGDIIPQEHSASPVARNRPMPEAPPDFNSIREFQNRLQMEKLDHLQNQHQYQQQFQDHSAVEQQMREARALKRAGKERLNEGAVRRIEMLVEMTTHTREVDLFGNLYVMRTLRSREMREAIMAAAEYDGTVQSPYEIRRQLLSRSLTVVAGVEVNQFVGSNSLEAKLELVDDLPEALLNRLLDEYQKMVEESKKQYAIKDEAEAQGVVADLKK